MAYDRVALEAELRLPRKNVPIVLYDNGEGVVPAAAEATKRGLVALYNALHP